MADELQDLIDFPAETLSVEHKAWLDLDVPLNRAKLARHICALANHGGGHLIFGISDTREYLPVDQLKSQYTTDSISSIVKKYLNPTFQCFVDSRTSKVGTEHVVVTVPSHKDIPICAIASGPHDASGKPQGVVQGSHYSRLPGPASAPLINAADWGPIIQRCVMARKDELLKDFASILSPRVGSKAVLESDALNQWHAATAEEYAYHLVHDKMPVWPVPLLSNRYHFSYRLNNLESGAIVADELVSLLQQAERRVDAIVPSGWSMFFPFDSQDMRPKFRVSTIAGQEKEFYECDLTQGEAWTHDFWRFSIDGYATLIRGFDEDRGVRKFDGGADLMPGTWISPKMLARNVSEFVSHAIAMAEILDVQFIDFKFSWIGLKDRKIDGESWRHRLVPRISLTDSRQVNKTVERVPAKAELHKLVPEVINPVLRLFDAFAVDENWMKSRMVEFRRP